MNTFVKVAKLTLLLGALVLTAIAAYPGPAEAAEGLVCWDEGNACAVVEDGEIHTWHGKFILL